ncbi:NAD(P)H-hydrate dehydratase [Altererythrobacter sp. Root672]|uniref:NAD(P)H-hydrate dehydratase n=1 Tax=Altererythrobacter sp. Root672 TaxID=1736584 RepID=UPI0006F6337A|nr:NAD(P)H-hydrate dehydratase [Altererythrobacter sp. Root672]KRA83974.1 NAD(P)H-hydrate dehydratase [Altererythrobacter sp. Root672]
MERLDRTWLQRHPLPSPAGGDKNARGRVLVVGGAEFVPGALRLTGEAALRAGAGKLQMATVRAAAMSLAVLMPEAAMIALPADEDGEIAPDAVELLGERLKSCDTLVLGPGMSASERTEQLVASLLSSPSAEQTIVLDAAALTCASKLAGLVAAHEGRVIMTPHHGEMGYLMGLPPEAVTADPLAAAEQVARDFRAVVVLKGTETLVAVPGREPLLFEGGNAGLATGGSGDVLAGLIGGLAARGAEPLSAAGWGVFVHGAAGERAAAEIAEIGFLARDLLPSIPGLLAKFGR